VSATVPVNRDILLKVPPHAAPVPMLKCRCGRPLLSRKGTRTYPVRGTSLVLFALEDGSAAVSCVCPSCHQKREAHCNSVVLSKKVDAD
jgi:hypothetical protein